MRSGRHKATLVPTQLSFDFMNEKPKLFWTRTRPKRDDHDYTPMLLAIAKRARALAPKLAHLNGEEALLGFADALDGKAREPADGSGRLWARVAATKFPDDAAGPFKRSVHIVEVRRKVSRIIE